MSRTWQRVLLETLGTRTELAELESLERALRAQGIEPVRFTEKQMLRRRLPVDGSTLVLARIPSMHAAMKLLGIELPEPDDYPEALSSLLHRQLWRSTVGQLMADLDLVAPVFAKPVARLKRFTGQLFESTYDLRVLHGVSHRTKVWCSEPVRFISEWRAFVCDDELLGVCRYKGTDQPVDEAIIRQAVTTLEGRAPRGYALDVGVLESGQTALVERNDGYGIGSYGLDDDAYLRVLEARWTELLGSRR